MSFTDAEMLKNIHSARGEFYSFLSRLFSNVPDNELYHMLEEMSVKLLSLKDSTKSEEIRTGTTGIIEFLEKRNSLSGKELTEFDLDTSRHYTSLFCLAKSIPVDESIYTSEEHRERQEPYDDMIRLFNRFGMKKTNRIPENEDFISYEFLFMSKLAFDCVNFIKNNQIDAYKEYLKAQYDFHINHFDKWVNEFFAKVVKSGIENERLYKFIAYIGAGFINEDKLSLKELMN